MRTEPSEITRILQEIGAGEDGSEERLLTLVYDKLRRIAGGKMARESPGHTLNTTALVHEAYLRLFGDQNPNWESRAHFFGAAAEAMRRILIDRYRQKNSAKHGGNRQRVAFDDDLALAAEGSADLLAINEALEKLEAQDPRKAQVVKYRYLLGLSVAETAELLNVSRRTVDDDWAFSKAWLRRELSQGSTAVG